MSVISSNLNAIVLPLSLDMDTPHLDNVEKYIKDLIKYLKIGDKGLDCLEIKMCRLGSLF